MSRPRHAAPRPRAAVRTSALISAPILLGGVLVATLPGASASPAAYAASSLRHSTAALTASHTTGTSARSATTSTATTQTAVAATKAAGTTAAATSSPATTTGVTRDPATWPAPTVTVSTEAQLVAAIAAAKPGTVIGLNAGTYSGVLTIQKSGTSTAPITLRPVGNAAVTLTATLPMPSCGATGPDANRTIRMMQGSSYWNFLGLNIRGGALISSYGAQYAQNWFSAKVNANDWQARRAVPGRSTNDPTAGRGALAYVAKVSGHTITPSTGVSFINNTITVKGIMARAAVSGIIAGNTVTNIACGTSPAIWLSTFSDYWQIVGNDVSNVAHSTASHYMEEGIRLGNSSAYDIIMQNNVHNLAALGRGIATDQDSSFNLIQQNTASYVYVGYNDEMSGWGNRWLSNTVTNYTNAGFSMRMADGKFTTPQMNSSTNGVIVKCNKATGAQDFQAGGMMNATIASNAFTHVFLGKNLRGYFGAQGNTWNGSKTTPGTTVVGSLTGC